MTTSTIVACAVEPDDVLSGALSALTPAAKAALGDGCLASWLRVAPNYCTTLLFYYTSV